MRKEGLCEASILQHARQLRKFAGIGLLCVAAAIAGTPDALGETYRLPLFVGETVAGQTGVLRIHNQSGASGDVTIYSFDDDGTRSSAATLTLAGGEAVELEASDLESGNISSGLTGGLGVLQGDVRLEMHTELVVKIFAYLRAADGTLSVLHDEVRERLAAEDGGYEYHVPVFNPAQNMAQASRLRLINAGSEHASIMIAGSDDIGATALGGTLSLALSPGGARTLDAQELEAGAPGLAGQLGTGATRWRLVVTSDQPLMVVSFVTDSTGRLDNLSSSGIDGLAPVNHGVFGERFLGMEIALNAGSQAWTLNILAEDAFTEMTESQGAGSIHTRSGSYTYKRASPDAGQLTLSYMEGDPCLLNLHYTSLAGGWYAWRCDSAEYSQGDWRGGSWAVLDKIAPPAPEPGPSKPRFSVADSPGDQNYTLGTAISPLTLPIAIGGNGTLTYSLAGQVSGLTFDPATRQIVGTPTEAGAQAMKYTVTDMDGDSDSLRFLIVVREAESTDCLLGLLLRSGDSCTYPGTSESLSINADGSAQFLTITSTRAINLPNRTYQGQVYDFRVSHQGDGVWRIDRLQGVEAPPIDTTPMFPELFLLGNQTYIVGFAIEALTLPTATRGEGALVYSLSPSVPGLTFDAVTRQLAGTPTQAGIHSMIYSVTDQEGDSDSLAFTITVDEPSPDLKVEPPSLSHNTLYTNESFTLGIIVRNQGMADSTAITLRYYRSSDMDISSADVEVDKVSVEALSPTATSAHSTRLTAPSAAGTYHYGACIDNVLNESNTENNCSTGVRLIVAEPPQVPDLIVEPPSVSASSLTPTQEFTLNVTVRNQGRVQSDSTTLRYYRSSIATVTDSDTEIGTDSVTSLSASATSFESIRITGPASAGTYYFGACVDAVANEDDTKNNCSTAVRITVRSPSPVSSDNDFDIDIVYVNSNASSSLRSAVASGAALWERAITRGLRDVDFSTSPVSNRCTNNLEFRGQVDDVRVYVHVKDIDGPSGAAATAGICSVRNGSGLPIISLMTFDSADMSRFSSSTLRGIAIHELAHALGFGILWRGLVNRSVVGGRLVDPPPDTHLPGSRAVAAFDSAGGSNYQGGKVPVENEFGGGGGRDYHWRSSVMGGEVMTYNLSGLAFSAITIQSMADLGYSVDVGAASSFNVSATPILPLVKDGQAPRCEIELHGMEHVAETPLGDSEVLALTIDKRGARRPAILPKLTDSSNFPLHNGEFAPLEHHLRGHGNDVRPLNDVIVSRSNGK